MILFNNKLSKKELTEYFNQIKSKDQTIGEEVWKSYPVPKIIKNFYTIGILKDLMFGKKN